MTGRSLKLSDIRNLVAILFSGFYLYQAAFGIVSPAVNRSMFICFGIVLVILNKPSKTKLWFFLDLLLVTAVIFGTIYFNLNYDRFAREYGLDLNTLDVIIGTLMIFISIEAVRRQLGWSIAILAIIFLLYLVFGRYFPRVISHGGFTYNQIVSEMYASTNGLYGSVTYTLATYMFLFLIFGAFLKHGGATDFYLTLSRALFGSRVGGSAKAAATSSFIMGMISGSASANVAITGQVTIPLMKQNGYSPAVAGGTEAAASLGGTILPPIMGASAFIMVALTGIPYIRIALYALIPAVLYYISVFMHCHFYAAKHALSGEKKENLPDLKETLKTGLHFILPILVLIFFLFRGESLQRVGLYSIISVVILSYVRKETRLSIKKILNALADGSKTALPIVAVAGPVGIISSSVLLPGMGLRVSGMIINMTGGSLALTILLIFIIGYILGMGLSIVPAYILLATLGAPALINLGIPVVAAHLLVLWYAQLSTITPPVCLGSYVAAGIAEAPFWETGMQGVIRAAAIFYLPVVFVYQPSLILIGETSDIILTVLAVLIGVFAIVGGAEGYVLRKMNIPSRIVVIAAGLLLFTIPLPLKGIGAAVFLGFVAYQWIRNRKTAGTESIL